MPTMQGGSFLKASANASRLTFQRNAIFPSQPNPTTWKTSLPISMPTDASAGIFVSALRVILLLLC